MATIFPAIYNITQKWSEAVDGTIADGYSTPVQRALANRMIQQGIRQTTNMMTVPLPLDQTAAKIVDVMERQALRLQGQPSDIGNHISDIYKLATDAETGDASAIYCRSETLRLKGFQPEIFPRNRQEIISLIDAKRTLASIQAIFQFCHRIKQAKETHAEPAKIKELIQKSKEFDGIENYLALNIARSTLQTLSTPVSSFAPSHVCPIEKGVLQNCPSKVETSSIIRQSFSLIYQCGASISSLAFRIAKLILFWR